MPPVVEDYVKFIWKGRKIMVNSRLEWGKIAEIRETFSWNLVPQNSEEAV